MSLECDFDDFESCGWHNVDTDDKDWTINAGKTPSSATGPKGDFSESGKRDSDDILLLKIDARTLSEMSATNSNNYIM